MSDIPLEYWPRCYWCGEILNEESIEVKTDFRGEKRRICKDCRDIIDAEIAEFAPYFLGQYLSHHVESPQPDFIAPPYKYLDPDELEVEARAKMENARSSSGTQTVT